MLGEPVLTILLKLSSGQRGNWEGLGLEGDEHPGERVTTIAQER